MKKIVKDTLNDFFCCEIYIYFYRKDYLRHFPHFENGLPVDATEVNLQSIKVSMRLILFT